MRTIKLPSRKDPETVEHEIQCRICWAIIGCKKSELVVSLDQRDTGMYLMTCPHCKKDTWTKLDLIK